MSRKTPLVYFDRAAQERAHQIVPGCVEVAVADAIVAGNVRFANGVALITGDGWEATASRAPGRLRRAPRAWRVTHVSRKPTTTTKE